MRSPFRLGLPLLILGLLLGALLYGFPEGNGAPPDPGTPTGSPRSTALDGPVVDRPAAGATGHRQSAAEPPGPPAPGAELALTGVVVGPDRAPIQGAEVVLEQRLGDGSLVPDPEARQVVLWSREARTGANGRFSFRAPYARYLRLRASAEGFGADSIAPVHAGQHYEVVLRPGASIAGRVTDAASGAPVADVAIEGWRSGDRTHLIEGRTAADGGFSFHGLPEGTLVLRLTPPLHEPPPFEELALHAGETARIDIALQRGQIVYGKVTDAGTGEPIAGAEVGAGWTFRKSTFTDAGGNYRLVGAPGPGVLDVQARAPRYARAVQVLPPKRRQVRVDFALQRAAVVRGRVVDAAGRPLSEVHVAASGRLPGEGEIRHHDRQGVRTGEDGLFALDQLVPGTTYSLILQKPGHSSKVFDLPGPLAAEPWETGDLVLDEPGAIAGRILDRQGHGIPDVWIQLLGSNADRGKLLGAASEAAPRGGSHRDTRSADDGRFWFGDLAAGSYRIVARVRNGPRGTLGDIAVRRGETTAGVVLVLDLGMTLAGRVRSGNGAPLPTEQVVVQVFRDGKLERFVGVDPAGRFSVSGLQPGGYDLVTEVGALVGGERPPWFGSGLQNIEAGRTDLELVLHPAIYIEGRIVDPAGAPRSGLSVQALEPGSGEEVDADRTDEDGRFELRCRPGQVLDLRYGTAAAAPHPNLVPPPDRATARIFRAVRAGTRGLVLDY